MVKKPVTRRGRRTRQKLLDAAEAIIGEQGFDNASIVEITQQAGVAQGTFYIYFPDKTAVFIELVKELSRSLRREIAEAVAGLDDRLEVERVGFRTFFRFTHKHRKLYRVVRQAEFVDEDIFKWYHRRLAEGYARGLEEAMEKGQIRRLDPECLAYCLMGIAVFVGMRWEIWTKEPIPDEIFDQMMTFIRHGMAFCPGVPDDPAESD